MNKEDLKKQIDKEMEELADLEFEYNVISKFCDDEGEKIIANGKWRRKLNRIRKMEDELYGKKEQESNIETQE